MKPTLILATALVAGLLGSTVTNAAANGPCRACHTEWGKTLPTAHPKVKGDLGNCVTCHKPSFQRSGATAPKKDQAFSAKIHQSHADKLGDCTVCHDFKPNQKFGLKGVKGEWKKIDENQFELLKELFTDYATSPSSSAARHGSVKLSCPACHGRELPTEGATVANSTCEICHGSQADIAKRTVPAKIPTANPHKSHQGDIACSICHKPHSQPKSYCNDCHKHFEQVMPELAPRK